MTNMKARFERAKFKALDKVIHISPLYAAVYRVIGMRFTRTDTLYSLLSPDGDSLNDVCESEIQLLKHDRFRRKYEELAMYVIVKNTAPMGLGINACAHVGFMAARDLRATKTFSDWEHESFRKRTCLVSPDQFEGCKAAFDVIKAEYVVFKEDDWGNQELSAAFSPMYVYPPIFKTLDLHPGFVE